MLEATIESCTIEYAENRGWWHRKCSWLGRRGAPDQLFVRDTVVLFVEFKKPGKKPERLQQKEHDKLKRKGANVYVIDSLASGEALFDSYDRQP